MPWEFTTNVAAFLPEIMDKVEVSIGVPVYNGEQSIAAALDSLLQQTWANFEILISDNASIDSTEAICRSYVQRDSRVRYVRQGRNIGAEANFAYVMRNACGKYFMWAASDDVRSPDFIALNRAFLEEHLDYVASTSPVRFENGPYDPIKMGDRGLHSDRFEQRMLDLFSSWHANGAYYSLMRYDAICDCRWVGREFFGVDWAIVLHVARQGKLNRVDQGWVCLGAGGASNRSDIFLRYRKDVRDLLAPLWRLTCAVRELSFDAPLFSRILIARACVIMNLRAAQAQLMGKLYRIYKSFSR